MNYSDQKINDFISGISERDPSKPFKKGEREIIIHILTQKLNYQELKNELASTQKLIETSNKQLNPIQENINNLTSQKNELDQSISDLEDRKSKIEEIKSRLNREAEALIGEKKQIRTNINDLLNKKDFYSETLSDHKKETIKNLCLNMGLVIVMLLIQYSILEFSYNFFEEALEEFKHVSDWRRMVFLFVSRASVCGFLFYSFYFFLNPLKKLIQNSYKIFSEIREIESKLILAREIAITSERLVPLDTPEEKRNYISFLKLSVLKNHFINLLHVKNELQIKEDKLKAIDVNR